MLSNKDTLPKRSTALRRRARGYDESKLDGPGPIDEDGVIRNSSEERSRNQAILDLQSGLTGKLKKHPDKFNPFNSSNPDEMNLPLQRLDPMAQFKTPSRSPLRSLSTTRSSSASRWGSFRFPEPLDGRSNTPPTPPPSLTANSPWEDEPGNPRQSRHRRRSRLRVERRSAGAAALNAEESALSQRQELEHQHRGYVEGQTLLPSSALQRGVSRSPDRHKAPQRRGSPRK